MKKVLSVVLSLAFIATGSLYADKAAGAKLAKSKCSSCHSPEKNNIASGGGPSWIEVSAAYKKGAGKDGIVKFLAGEGKPIVVPEKFNTMKTQIKVTKKFSDEQKTDVADFILSH